MWDALPEEQQVYIRAAIAQSVYYPELLFHETSAASLDEVKRPSDFDGELVASLDDRTFLVEFERPRDSYERDVLGLTTESDGPVRLRGWYIQGPGVMGKAQKRALIIRWGGRSNEFTATAPNHLVHYVYAGFDVLVLDKRGHGVSEGQCSFDDVAMAEDTFEVLRQLESGDGLKSIGPDGVMREGSEAIGLLPGTAENTPLVLWGYSQGTLVCSWALTKNITEEAYQDFDIRGYVSFAGDDVFTAGVDPMLFLLGGYFSAEIGFEGALGEPSTVYQHMDQWPAYFQAKGLSDDVFAPEGAVLGYNKVLGLKQIAFVPTAHDFDEYRRYTQSRALKLAQAAVLRRHAWFQNTDQTTLEEQACKALALP